MQSRKQEILDRLIEHLVRRGLADLSLRPMAAETGTSARLLIFHFGSKDQLLAEVFAEMQARLRFSLAKLHLGRAEGAQPPLLRVFWDWATAERNRGYLGLQYQLQVLAARSPETYGRFLKQNAQAWVETIQAALPPQDRDAAFATLLVGVFDGLFLEFMSTGDLARTTAALDCFIERMGRAGTAARKPRSSR